MDIRKLLREYKIKEAFLQIIDASPSDESDLRLYQRVLGINWNLFKLLDLADKMESGAEKGDPRLQYAWARFNDAVRPSPDSVQLAIKYYRKAGEAGIVDAAMCLAHLWNEGAFGLVDRDKYKDGMQKAMDAGSEMAVLQNLRDRIWGYSGFPMEPRAVYEETTGFIEKAEAAKEDISPQFYTIVGCACEELGRSLEAYTWYKQAYAEGDPKACFKMAVLSGGLDDDGYVVRKEDFMKIIDDGIGKGIPDCELYPAFMISEEDRNWNEAESLRHLEKAFSMGESTGACFLGEYYHHGRFGFGKDLVQAWEWYRRGASLNNCYCYQAMADMILEGEAPSGYDYDFMYDCELMALRFGYDDTLVNVVRAYRQGHLTEFAEEIEKYYSPVFEELYESDHFDDEDFQQVCP